RLESPLAYRPAITAADLGRHAELPGPALRVGIGGSHGFIGTALGQFLTAGGHSVVRLGRSISPGDVEGLDAVVNLAGAGIADGRGTSAREQLLRDSRGPTTAPPAHALAPA